MCRRCERLRLEVCGVLVTAATGDVDGGYVVDESLIREAARGTRGRRSDGAVQRMRVVPRTEADAGVVPKVHDDARVLELRREPAVAGRVLPELERVRVVGRPRPVAGLREVLEDLDVANLRL